MTPSSLPATIKITTTAEPDPYATERLAAATLDFYHRFMQRPDAKELLERKKGRATRPRRAAKLKGEPIMPQTKTAALVLQHRNGQTKTHHLYSTPHQPHLQGFRQFHANGLRVGRVVCLNCPGPGRRSVCPGRAGLLPGGGWAALKVHYLE